MKNYNKITEENDLDITNLTKEEIINECSELVIKIAGSLYKRLPKTILLDDLIQEGYVGLLEALKNYTSSNTDENFRFKLYASQRIRGAMIDYLRETDTLSRRYSMLVKSVDESRNSLEHQKCRKVTDSEVSNELNIPLSKVLKAANLKAGRQIESLDKFYDSGRIDTLDSIKNDSNNPLDELIINNLVLELHKKVELFSGINKKVFHLIYQEEKTSAEVSRILNKSEARISQIRKIINKLNLVIKNHV